MKFIAAASSRRRIAPIDKLSIYPYLYWHEWVEIYAGYKLAKWSWKIEPEVLYVTKEQLKLAYYNCLDRSGPFTDVEQMIECLHNHLIALQKE